MGLFQKFKEGLKKTSESLSGKIDDVLFSFKTIDEDLLEELEEVLILSDVGVETSTYIIEKLRERIKAQHVSDPAGIRGLLADVLAEVLRSGASEKEETDAPQKEVILVIGVNGVGKTTSIAKLANLLKGEGKRVMLAAADTFRAAAVEQLSVWAERVGVPIIKHGQGADPGAVVFDALSSMKSRGTDVLICDTAGRLHNKVNLMNELAKISKIIDREMGEAKKEVYLVLDATTGQNALQQAKLFAQATPITGIILTKLDGSAKGGVVVSICHEQEIPVKYVGVGEKQDDLQVFDPQLFARALVGEEE